MTALGLPLAAVVLPFVAVSVGAIAWLLADTPGLQTRSDASIGALLSDEARAVHDEASAISDLSTSRPLQECA